MLEGDRGRDAEAEVLGHHRHGGHELQRVVDRDLRALPDGLIRIALVDVVDAQYVGDEDAIEDATLQSLREPRPVFEVLVLPGAVARMGPQPRRLVPDAIHVEGVEPDLPGHGISEPDRGAIVRRSVVRSKRADPIPIVYLFYVLFARELR